MNNQKHSDLNGSRHARIRLLPVLSRLLFPVHCARCDTLLLPAEVGVCCRCAGTSRPQTIFLPRGRAVFPYTGAVRASLQRMKYHGRAEYAGYYVTCMERVCGAWIHAWAPDVMIPVPIHRRRRQERGYNQADELARGLSRRLGIPWDGRCVVRVRATRPQNALSPAARKENVRGAFAFRGRSLPARVLLIDDIYTTGSTTDELCRLLRAHGAREVRILCVAVAETREMCYNDSV